MGELDDRNSGWAGRDSSPHWPPRQTSGGGDKAPGGSAQAAPCAAALRPRRGHDSCSSSSRGAGLPHRPGTAPHGGTDAGRNPQGTSPSDCPYVGVTGTQTAARNGDP